DRANRELARLLGAIGSGDFAHSFTVGELGGSFGALGQAFEHVLRRFRDARLSGEERRAYLEALIEQVPVALLSVRDDGTVELMTGAARRLLNASSRTTLDALHAYGASFQRDVAQSRPGSRTLTRTVFDGVERHLILSTAQITVRGVAQRLT